MLDHLFYIREYISTDSDLSSVFLKFPVIFDWRTLVRFDICYSCVSPALAAVTSKHLLFQTGFGGGQIFGSPSVSSGSLALSFNFRSEGEQSNYTVTK